MKGIPAMKISMFLYVHIIGLAGFVQTNSTDRIYEIWDEQPAPNRGITYNTSKGYPFNEDCEAHSYIIGNGYMGANVFGRTDIERIQITKNVGE